MKRKRMAKSVRKFIRKEKTRIRREILSVEEQNKSIAKLYQKINYDYKRNLQSGNSNGN